MNALKKIGIILLCCFSIFSTPNAMAVEKTPVIISLDMAPDDILALLYMLNQKNIDILAIAVTGTGEAYCDRKNGNIAGAVNVIKLINFLGKSNQHIPVACGETTPMTGNHVFPTTWRDDASDTMPIKKLKSPISIADKEKILQLNAVDVIIDALQHSKKKVNILILGPATNMGMVLARRPDLADKIESITLMGGAVNVPGNMQVPNNHTAEWNVYIDPKATQTLFESNIPINLIGLDVTNQLPATWELFEKIQRLPRTPSTQIASHFFLKEKNLVKENLFYFWDPLAAAIFIDPSICAEYIPYLLTVNQDENADESGRTYHDLKGHTVHVCTRVNKAAFMALFWRNLM